MKKAARNPKKSPRSIPRTQQDVQRAHLKGRDEGIEFILNIVTWILVDRHEAPDGELLQFSREIAYLCDSIARGYVSYPDIVRALKAEHGWTVELAAGREAAAHA